jgi:hypothetical protein
LFPCLILGASSIVGVKLRARTAKSFCLILLLLEKKGFCFVEFKEVSVNNTDLCGLQGLEIDLGFLIRELSLLLIFFFAYAWNIIIRGSFLNKINDISCLRLDENEIWKKD